MCVCVCVCVCGGGWGEEKREIKRERRNGEWGLRVWWKKIGSVKERRKKI